MERNCEVDSELKQVMKAVKKQAAILEKNLKWFLLTFKDLRMEGGLLYYEKRLVISKDLRHPSLDRLHKRHPGRDAMLAWVADIFLQNLGENWKHSTWYRQHPVGKEEDETGQIEQCVQEEEGKSNTGVRWYD